MKTDRLEEFIKANRGAFDNLEPSVNVWENISKQNPGNKKLTVYRYTMRAAAVLAIAVLFTVAVVKTSHVIKENEKAKAIDPELVELIEAEAFYASQVNSKLEEIRKCYETYPEIKEEVESDLMELQEMYNSLKDDLKENISRKAVIEAMIENNRYRLKMVDQVLEQINC